MGMETYELYEKVHKAGVRNFRIKTSQGKYPYLQVLDEILSYTEVVSEVTLGLVEIPIDQIVGTKTAGRTNAFASNFMPLLPIDSEFATKWCNLYEAHIEEGIREPVKAYEFMNRFYIEEGNKRVSVLKYCDAVTVPGYVTRLVPKQDDSDECRIYYEFMEFYDRTQINYLNFSQPGNYQKILERIGIGENRNITEEEREQFHTTYVLFSKAFEKKGGKKLSLTFGDAFLLYLGIYEYEEMLSKSPEELEKEIEAIWNDFTFYPERPEVKLIMDADQDVEKKPLVKLLLPLSTEPLKIAFIHNKSVETSSWTYGHDLGSNHVKAVLGDKVSISSYFQADSAEAENKCFEKAIKEGNTVIFSTSQSLLAASTKYAISYPKLKILNCSLNTSCKYLRTYYGRLYEAKFLIGAIAGVMSPSDKIGYIADYPIYGTIANINAFALGAKMVNPNAKIFLKWSKLRSEERQENRDDYGLAFVSGRDFIRPDDESARFGLYNKEDEGLSNLAMPVWNWGVFYERIVKSILNGTWKQELPKGKNESLNYWWGLSSGMIDVICSKRLPKETAKLIDLLKRSICLGEFTLFSGDIPTNTGTVYHGEKDGISTEEIVTMDWLADNVIGFIPTIDELVDEAKTIVEVQGIAKAKGMESDSERPDTENGEEA